MSTSYNPIISQEFNGRLVVVEDGKNPLVYRKKSTNETKGVSWQCVHLEHNLALPNGLAEFAELKVHATIVPKSGKSAEFRQWFDSKAKPVAQTQQNGELELLRAQLAALQAQIGGQKPVEAVKEPVQDTQPVNPVPTIGLPDLGSQIAEAQTREKWKARIEHVASTKRFQELDLNQMGQVKAWLGSYKAKVLAKEISDEQALKEVNSGLQQMGFVRVKVS